MDLTPELQQMLMDHAREVIRARLSGAPLPPLPADASLQENAGCFVTLHTLNGHQLRGCIGRLYADAPLGETVREMADAVLEDSRFADWPVTLDELPDLELEITVLSPLEPASGPLDFNLIEHGIYLQHKGRGGCFLPQVARETGWDRATLLARLCTEKMGLPAEAWRDPEARLMRFHASVLGPQPFIPAAD